VLVPQAELSPERLAALLGGCSRERLLEMAIAARRLGRTDAAERVAQACVTEARRR
jgi:UDP-N-acetylglucosamine--N-acetylmuramyl-(pentapeptide) pyrophosphoryl-undecaprenol N-acetylglucosamine transferase